MGQTKPISRGAAAPLADDEIFRRLMKTKRAVGKEARGDNKYDSEAKHPVCIINNVKNDISWIQPFFGKIIDQLIFLENENNEDEHKK